MQLPGVPQDDLTDIQELSDKIELSINEILSGHDNRIAYSALISALINCIVFQSETFEDILIRRIVFVKALDDYIRSIRMQKQQNPPAASS